MSRPPYPPVRDRPPDRGSREPRPNSRVAARPPSRGLEELGARVEGAQAALAHSDHATWRAHVRAESTCRSQLELHRESDLKHVVHKAIIAAVLIIFKTKSTTFSSVGMSHVR